jgi:uncharacterized membrane protein YdjX (TVP38/TMEM64 family)
MASGSKNLRRSMLFTKLLLALVLLAGGAFACLHLEEARAWTNLGLEWIRLMGPVPFFTAMAVLPAFGCPVSAFTFTAGPTFIPQMGTLWVCVLVSLGMTLDLALAYWLARYTARPLLSRLMARMGYKLPKVAPGDHTGLTVLLRVTPGPPLFIQNYLLGLAEVPFKTYILISAPIMSGWALAAVLASDALVAGKGRTAFLALGLVAGLLIAVRMVRRHYARRQPPPPPPPPAPPPPAPALPLHPAPALPPPPPSPPPESDVHRPSSNVSRPSPPPPPPDGAGGKTP